MEESSNSFKETTAQNVCEAEVHHELNQIESDQEYVCYVNAYTHSCIHMYCMTMYVSQANQHAQWSD